MNEEGARDARQTNSTLVPSPDLDACSVEDVFTKHDRVGASPTEQENVHAEHAGDEEFGFAVHELEVVLFAAVFGDCGSELEVDGHAGGGNKSADDPEDEGEADGPGEGEDGGGGGEDAGADHAVED